MDRDIATKALDEHFVLVSCEGETEEFIFSKLLEAGKIRVPKSRLIEDPKTGEHYTSLESAKDILDRFGSLSYCSDECIANDDQFVIARIRDRKSEGCRLDRKLKGRAIPIDFLTYPEIEMLIVLREGLLPEFDKAKRKQKMKVSDFCNSLPLARGYKTVKSYKFLNDYWSNVDDLVDAILEYRKRLPKSKRLDPHQPTLSDMLLSELIA